MKKQVAAAVLGLALIAGQAAASEGAVLQAGDRVGSDEGAANDFLFHMPAFVWLFGAGFVGVESWAATDHGGRPISP